MAWSIAVLSKSNKLPRSVDELLRGEHPDVVKGDDKLVAFAQARQTMKQLEKKIPTKKKKKPPASPPTKPRATIRGRTSR